MLTQSPALRIPRSFLALLLLAFTAFGASACATDELGSDTQGIDGRPFFELFVDEAREYRFHLSAANHEIVLSSEGYSSRTAALAGILSVIDNSASSDNFELREARDGQFYFVLRAANGQTIGMSELYSSKSNATRGIADTMNVVEEYLAFLATRTGARFEIFEGQNGLHYFRLVAKNGEIVLASQAYSSHAAALNGTFAVSEAGLYRGNYQVNKAASGEYYFNLLGANNEVIGTSEMYHNASNARRGRNDVMELLPNVELL